MLDTRGLKSEVRGQRSESGELVDKYTVVIGEGVKRLQQFCITHYPLPITHYLSTTSY